MRPLQWIRRHLHSWEQICFDDFSRLRFNVILFTFTVACFFFIMGIRTLLLKDFLAAVPTLSLGLVTTVLFACQFSYRKYSAVIAWLFGLMSLLMAIFFISNGGTDGTIQYGYLWLYILPIVGTMMVRIPGTILYNGILLLLCILLLWSPLYQMLQAEYEPYFRTVYPITLLFVMLCNYVAEFIRHRTRSELVRNVNKMRDYSYTDPLTGAYNRRALEAHFGNLDNPAYGLSFAVCDLDFFKKVNDDYGHDVGDKVLCHVVKIIRETIPANAGLYRWGGEEFLVVFKTADEAKAERIAEEIRRKMESTPLEIPQTQLVTTISIGLYCAPLQGDIATGIACGDQRLYEAKSLGRNQVVSSRKPG